MKKTELKQLALDDIARSGLDESDFRKMKLQVCDGDEAEAILNSGFSTYGYLIPYLDVHGKVTDSIRFRFLDELRNGQNKPVRYSQPKYSEPRLYFSPCVKWLTILDDTAQTIVICEGEKKSYAACKKGIPTIGLGGVWSFKSKRLQRQLIDDFKLVELKNRKIILCFDNDIKVNPNVMHALQSLAAELKRADANVKIKYLPDNPYQKIGLDDYLLENSKDDFDNLPEDEPLHPDIIELNNDLAVVPVGDKVLILREEKDIDNPNRTTIGLYKPSDMITLFANRKIAVMNGESSKEKPLFQHWLENPARRTFKGITFIPDGDLDDYYNLFKGLAIVSKKGSCKLFKKNILENISQGDKKIYNYIMSWLADAIQNPSKRCGVAIVLRGRQGVGKGVLVNNFGKIFGQHFIRVDSPSQITGRFNFHLKDKLIVFIDEGFWAGDKSAEGKIKGIVTEPTLSIEGKNKDIFVIKNYMRILIASNSEWIIPAGLEERRFFTIDVGEKHMQDTKYFGAIQKEIDNGGLEALLYELIHYDLSKVNLNDFPKTQALLDQKINSMDSVQSYWFQILNNADLCKLRGGWNGGKIECKALSKNYIEVSKDIGITRRAAETELGIKLRKLCPTMKKKRELKKTVIGKEVTNKQIQYYYFPDLHTCRTDFEKLLGTSVKWDK